MLSSGNDKSQEITIGNDDDDKSYNFSSTESLNTDSDMKSFGSTVHEESNESDRESEERIKESEDKIKGKNVLIEKNKGKIIIENVEEEEDIGSDSDF